MKPTKTYLTIAAAALLALSCSKQEGEPKPPVDNTPAELAISVGVDAATTRSVVTGTAFVTGQEINVILNDAEATSVYKGEQMAYRFTKPTEGSAGVWMPVLVPPATQGLMTRTEKATLLAHYPATLPTGASVDKPTAVLTPVVATEQAFGDVADGRFDSYRMQVSTIQGAQPEDVYLCKSEVDYLTGSVPTVSKTANNVTITMKHALAMVVLCVDKDPANAAPCEMRYFELKAKAGTPMLDGTFSMTDNTFTPKTTAQAYRRTMSGFGAGTNFGMLIYPAENVVADAVELEFRVDYERYTVSLPAQNWESGRVTLYKVKIEGNKAILDQTINIKEWPTAIEHPLPLE